MGFDKLLNEGDFRMVRGAQRSDDSQVSYWRAKELASHSDCIILGPVRFSDDVHGVVVAEEYQVNPRRDDSPNGRIGTFAFPTTERLADDVPYNPQDGRLNWWRDCPSANNSSALRWMMQQMRLGVGQTVEEAPRFALDDPSLSDLQEAADAYHDLRGEFAFPCYVTGDRKDERNLRLHMVTSSEMPPRGSRAAGFILLSRHDIESIVGTGNTMTVKQAADALTEAVAIYSDWQDDKIIKASCFLFTNKPHELPAERSTGACLADSLTDIASATLSAMWEAKSG